MSLFNRVWNARPSSRKLLYSLFFATIVSLSFIWGRSLSRVHGLENPIITLSDVILGLSLGIVVASVLFVVFTLLKSASFESDSAVIPSQERFCKNRFIATWAIIIALWIPVLLAYWPTIWAYDVYNQVPFETGKPFDTLHPLLHTLFIQGGISLGKALTGSYETGMVILSMTQMTTMAGVFSYTVEKLRTMNVPSWLAYALLIYFIFMPFNPIMALSQTKDTLFSGCFLLLFILHWEVLHNEENTGFRALIPLFCATVLLLALRNNAVYAYLVWLVLSFVLPGRAKRLNLNVLGICAIVLSLLLNIILAQCLSAKQGPPEEAYSVPIQSLTRIASLHSEYVPEYGNGDTMFDGLVLRDVFPEEFSSIYQPANADPAKNAWEKSSAATGTFEASALIRKWLMLSIKHPFDSFVAWSLLTKGAWYPLDTSHAHVYDYRTKLVRQGYLLTDYKVFEGMSDPRPASKIPALENFLEEIATNNIHHKSLFLTLLLSPASYAWLLLSLIWVSMYRKQDAFPLLFSLLYLGTIMLAPLIIVRYMYPIMLVAPTALCLSLRHRS